MSHVRQQIRDRVVADLIAGVALVSGRVYKSRVYPIANAALPAITVHSGSEQSALQSMGLVTISRVLDVNVDIYENATANLDDAIDAIAVQVENSIGADPTLNGLVKAAVLRSTEIEYNGESETPVGIARLTFAVDYITAVTDAETAR